MSNTLFREYDLSRYLENNKHNLAETVASQPEEQILQTAHSVLCEHFVQRFTIDAPVIDEDGIRTDYGDTKVDVRHHPDRYIRDRSRPALVGGTKVSYFVPFDGDDQLLRCKPSTYGVDGGLQAVCRDDEIVLVYSRTPQKTSEIKDAFQQDLNKLKNYLTWISNDVRQHNDALEALVDQYVSSRRDKVLNDRELVESLGFPLRRSSNAPTTFTTPTVKRRVVPRLPPVSAQPFRPEPALDMDEYEHILGVITSMVLVIERSPQHFAGIREEALRSHFLVQLNGQYEGQATGETFNYEGKTDILIRDGDRNVFIAECKFWSGPSGMSKSIDQLLGYTCWRDTKTALLIFNRNKNMTKVLQKMHDSLESHPNFKSWLDYPSETGFRCVFTHRDDPNREITLTTLIFDVPA